MPIFNILIYITICFNLIMSNYIQKTHSQKALEIDKFISSLTACDLLDIDLIKMSIESKLSEIHENLA